jgi:hypothetical protein
MKLPQQREDFGRSNKVKEIKRKMKQIWIESDFKRKSLLAQPQRI